MIVSPTLSNGKSEHGQSAVARPSVNGHKPLFAAIPHWIIDDYGAKIGPLGIAVLVVLIRHADEDHCCFPSHDRIARLAGISVSSAQRALAVLSAVGLVSIESHAKTGRRNNYRLTLGPCDRPSLGPTDRLPRSQGPTPSVRGTDPLGPTDRPPRSQGPTKKNQEEEPKRRTKKKNQEEAARNEIVSRPDEAASRTRSQSRSGSALVSFDAFWAVYPRKAAKKGAEAAWRTLAPSATLQTEIIAAVERQKTSRQWTRDRGQYIPYPATWLNGRRWEDQPEDQQGPDGTMDFAGLKDFLQGGQE